MPLVRKSQITIRPSLHPTANSVPCLLNWHLSKMLSIYYCSKGRGFLKYSFLPSLKYFDTQTSEQMSDYSPSEQQQDFSKSSAFKAALLRAKQIAAKIQPGSQQPSVGGQKRPLDDFEGDLSNKRFSGGSNSPPSNQGLSVQQQARELAARLGGNPGNAPSDALQKAREAIRKMVGGVGNGGGPPSHMSRPGLGSGNYNNGNASHEEVMIPGSKVGLIIGKGGETIKQLMEKTGAKLVVVQEGPGQENEKPLRITGDYEKVQHAKQLVEELLTQKDQQQQQYQQRNNNFNNNDHQGGPPRGGGGYPGPGGPGGHRGNHQGGDYENMEMVVPKAAVGVVIGKGGEMIKKIASDTGAKMQFIQGSDPNGDRRCVIQGPRHLVEEAKRAVDELVDGVLRRKGMNEGNGGQDMNYANYSGPMVSREEYSFTVPASKCGIIIGRGGDTIKQINSQSGAHCEMDRKTSANMVNEKAFTIKGEQHQIDEAKRLIQDKINVELTMTHLGSTQVPAPNTFANNPYGVAAAAAWGAYSQQWDQSQAAAQMAGAAQAGAGGADYSQQWIDYYKQMGMHREAEMIEQQIKMRGNGQGAQPAANGQAAPGNPAAGAAAAQGQADYSAQWAEYYRRMGKVEEAEAIEKQMAAQKSGGGAPAAPNPAGAPNPAQFYPQMAAYGQYQQYYGAQAYPGYPGGPQQPPQPGQPQPPAPASQDSK
uniref:CSON000608 protein n=1 Tax=Culicoides sonorensis TaxID=179676 RepID=A0A336KYJ9_CULSO